MSEDLNEIICKQCGRCCANILLLSDNEIQKIKKYLKNHPDVSTYNRNTVMMKEDVNICPFLHKDNLGENYCAIYEVRPSICRSYNCNSNYKVDMDYNGVKAINMLLTFGGDKQFTINPPDLTPINNRLKILQDKINKKGKKK